MQLLKTQGLSGILILTIQFVTYAQLPFPTDDLPIQPLKSTRSEVDKLGNKVESNPLYTEYEIEQGKMRVRFSKEPCIWHGWNVGLDTVIEYKLYPKQKFLRKDINQAIFELPVLIDDIFTEHFADSKNGRQYVFSRDGVLSYIDHTPTPSDGSLRCRGFAPYTVAGDTYVVFESYEVTDPKNWEVSRLGGFLTEVKKSSGSKGTLFIYPSKRDKPMNKTFIWKIERYAFKIIGIPKDQFSIVFGGYRDSWEMESTLGLRTYPSPIPRPKYPTP